MLEELEIRRNGKVGGSSILRAAFEEEHDAQPADGARGSETGLKKTQM